MSKAELKDRTIKQDRKAGKAGDVIKITSFQFTVVGDPEYTGRKVFENFEPNGFTFVQCRKIADATGVPQTGSFEDWLKELTQIQPTIKVVVAQVEKYSDKTQMDNAIDWKSGVQPGDVA